MLCIAFTGVVFIFSSYRSSSLPARTGLHTCASILFRLFHDFYVMAATLASLRPVGALSNIFITGLLVFSLRGVSRRDLSPALLLLLSCAYVFVLSFSALL